jgi:CRP/FNR family transcriptional regulator, cyclic AMP receptor protein
VVLAPWWQSFCTRPARRLAPGAFVYLKGDTAQSVYLLRSGLVKISVVWRDGRELIVRLARPGELFGKTSLGALEHGEHARALEPSEIVEIPAADLVAQMARDPGTVAAVFKEFALRLREARQTVEGLAFASTMERLCLVLGKLASELGQPDGPAVMIPHYIRQEDVARMTGARREVVSGLLNRLREKGVIGYSRKGSLRVDRGALDRYVQLLKSSRVPVSKRDNLQHTRRPTVFRVGDSSHLE